MNRIWSILWKVGLVIVIITVIVFANITHKKTPIKEMNVNVTYNKPDTLVTALELKQIIDSNVGSLIGKEVRQINTSKLEQVLLKNPFVSTANVYISLRGNVTINATQREPIVRVKSDGNVEFYIDKNGITFPISTTGSSRVMIASGKIKTVPKNKETHLRIENLRKDSLWNKSEIINVFDLANYIYNHPFLNATIDQIYVNANTEFELVPKIGDHIILLGNTDNLDEKFEKLIALYKEGFTNLGWDLYSVINLKFKNQVVCTKK